MTLSLGGGKASQSEKLFAGLERASERGIAEVKGYFGDEQLRRLAYEVRHTHLLRRKVAEWIGTDRATLFMGQEPPDSPRYKRVAARLLRAERFLPESFAAATTLAQEVRKFGEVSGCQSLENYTPNRLGVNYMHGTSVVAAHIPPQTDPIAETGVVLAVDLGEDAWGRGGSISVILGHDACAHFGISQAVHEVTAYAPRYSLTIAQLS